MAVIAALNHLFESLANGSSAWIVILGSLDLITIAVPPALPLILTAGVEYAIQRLKRSRIFCINPERVPYAGRLDTICWDKTGTLTTSKITFDETKSFCTTQDGKLDFSLLPFCPLSLERSMVVCHGVTVHKNENVGYSLDVESFEKTGWLIYNSAESRHFNNSHIKSVNVLQDPKTRESIYTLRRLDFEAHLQLSSVVSLSQKDIAPIVSSKGSPEAIKQICNSIPANYDQMCKQYALDGKYVIACASKQLQYTPTNIHDVDRAELETNLTFLGFLVFENHVRAESFSVIQELKAADLASIIITGDNILTAIHVAKQLDLCKTLIVIDVHQENVCFSRREGDDKEDYLPIAELANQSSYELQNDVAITGEALSKLIESRSALIESWIMKTRIFARIKPDQKTWIINFLISKGKYVAMCGDGTNDCGALKAAHVGLAFSDAEASIVAPFTSAYKKVEDVIVLIRHGRCALETCFLGFKYMTLYPLMQLAIVASLHRLQVTLGNNQFLFDDLFVVTGLAVLAMYHGPSAQLRSGRPGDSLFEKEILSSIIGQLVIFFVFFGINYVLSVNQSWFCPSSRILAGNGDGTNTTNSEDIVAACFKY